MKKINAIVCAFVVLCQVGPASARMGTAPRSSQQSSQSRALTVYRAPSENRAVPASQYSAGRFGGGQSMGIQRPDVADRARMRDESAVSYGSGRGYQPQSAAVPQAQKGLGWGTVAGAAAAAGAVGYLAGRSDTGPAYPMGQMGGGMFGSMPGMFGLPQLAASSGGFGWGSVLLALLALGGMGMFLSRKQSMRPAAGAPTTEGGAPFVDMRPQWAEELFSQAHEHFREIQAASNRGDLSVLSKKLGPQLFREISVILEKRGGPENSTFPHLRSSLEDATEEASGRQIVSIRFSGTVVTNGVPDQMDELWHFVRSPQSDAWLLDGFEQINRC